MQDRTRGCILIAARRLAPFYGGGAMVAERCARGFAARGERVVMMTTTRDPDPVEGVEIITVATPRWYDLPKLQAAARLYDLIHIALIARNLLRLRPSVIHCVGASQFSLAAMVAARIVCVPSVLETSLIDSDDPLTIASRSLGSLHARAFALASLVVNVSKGLYDRCLEAGLPEDQCLIIPNSVDSSLFYVPTDEERSGLREKLGLIQFERIFVFVGVLRPRKDPMMSLEVFRRIVADHPRSGLLLVGPAGKDRESQQHASEIEERIREWGLESSVVMTGYVSNVHEWLRASDFFLFFSRMEGFGTVYAEAMSVGLPTITRPIDGVTDYIFEDGRTGFVVDDVDQAVEVAEQLLRDADRYASVSRAAAVDAERRFSERVVLDSYAESYRMARDRLRGLR